MKDWGDLVVINRGDNGTYELQVDKCKYPRFKFYCVIKIPVYMFKPKWVGAGSN